MKALVYNDAYDVPVDDVDDARIEDPTDAVVRITTTTIRGSDLHIYEGSTDVEQGKVLGQENMGVVFNALVLPEGTELPLRQAPEGYQRFDKREHGWTKVVLHPEG